MEDVLPERRPWWKVDGDDNEIVWYRELNEAWANLDVSGEDDVVGETLSRIGFGV